MSSRGDKAFPTDFNVAPSKPVNNSEPNFSIDDNIGQLVNKTIDPHRVEDRFYVQIEQKDLLFVFSSSSVDVIVEGINGSLEKDTMVDVEDVFVGDPSN